MIQVHLTGILGTSITVDVNDESEILKTLRHYGRKGWVSGEIPTGGLVLPFVMADVFDWNLLGAREYTTPEGEQMVIYRNQGYKRRELDEIDTKKLKLPKIVKYSRGAKSTDPSHLREGDESGVQYITLITFRGGGSVLRDFVDPAKMGKI